jgi:tRNA (guanine37-N1)-methyltransferase
MPSHTSDSSHPVNRGSLIAIGIIRRPHGVRGEASVEPWTDEPSRFESLSRLFLVSPDDEEIVELPIASVRRHGDRVLVGLAGIETPERVRDFQGWTVEIPETERLETDEDEYYLYELEGLTVVDPEGEKIGEVLEAVEGGGGFLLVVRDPAGRSFDVPLVRDICVEIDIEGGRIVAELPEGLHDLDTAEMADSRESRRLEGTLHDPLPARIQEEPPVLENPVMRIDVVTIFPPMFEAIRNEGIIARALRRNIIDLRVHDLRDFATDSHRSTDDEAYGGGAGMVMLAEPLFRCVEAIGEAQPVGERPKVVLLSPQGRRLSHEVAAELARVPWLVLLCGRYEGVDERVIETVVDEEISIGDFVVSGGELPAMVVIDAVGRLVEDVVGDRNSVEADSFYNRLLDHPHYTRPAEIRGLGVPEVLLSGHAERIRQWRKRESLRATMQKRPDLLQETDLDEEAIEMLRQLRDETHTAGD